MRRTDAARTELARCHFHFPFSIFELKGETMTETNHSIDELKSALKEMGEKPFRAGQIFKWLHEGVESFEEMSNLSRTYGRVWRKFPADRTGSRPQAGEPR
ncbi:MAG: hypothetical protein ACLSGI_01200 [Butyricicoccaceae bacterium]